MSELSEIKAIVRKDCVHRVVEALRDAGVTHFYVCHVHVLGAGVDPKDFRVSLEEGEAYAEMSKIEFLCLQDRVEELLGVMRAAAATGHVGDGIAVVSEVVDVMRIWTGDRGSLAIV
ncbi:MAG: P-II family nitrogen regulator [Gemmatimonadota bacterium]